jgi:hypothetical protein
MIAMVVEPVVAWGKPLFQRLHERGDKRRIIGVDEQMKMSRHQAVVEYFDSGVSGSYTLQLLQKEFRCGLYPKAAAMVVKPRANVVIMAVIEAAFLVVMFRKRLFNHFVPL